MSQATFVDPAVELARLVAGARGLLSEASVLAGSGAVSEVQLAGLPELTAELFAVRDAAHALGTVAVDRLDASGVLASAGFGSTTAFLTQRTGMAPGRAGSVVSGARTLRSYAATRVALVAGRVTPDLAAALVRGSEAAIADKTDQDRVQWRAFCEDYLLPIAEQGSVEEVGGAAAVLREILDPEAAARRKEEAMAGQFLTVTQVGDQFVIKGALTLEDGAALKTLLDRMRDAKYRTGSLTPDEQPTGDAAVDERRRRIAAAHQDALSLNHLVQLWLANGMVGRAHGVRPHVTITTSVDDLEAGFPAEMTVPGVSGPVLVNADTVKRMLCDASVTEISTAGSVADRHAHHHDGIPCHGAAHHGRHGHVHGVVGCELHPGSARLLRRRHHVWDEGRRYRTVPPRLRRALDLRDRHCAFPGCRIAVGWCEAHHITEWEHGGATDLDNLTLLCAKHHHAVHEGGWTIVKNPGIDPGCPTWLTVDPPDPSPVRTRP
ncbi:HNH endonuclease signature motif containing protein [Longivirga aurantiaca]|uniref:DUF222 domain-containing protein n=1 Tax=Longivirga aurantiaca TaxID=1837743 RepID=A0ABW1T345_9ACTN